MLTTNLAASPWDIPANVEALKQMWLDGSTASEIAAVFSAATGTLVSRDSIIGKVHRLKLKAHGPGPRITVSGHRSKRGGAGSPGQAKAANIVHRVEGRLKAERARQAGRSVHIGNEPFRAGSLPDDEAGVDVTHLVGLMELNAHTCRWPVGEPRDPDFGFCGKVPVEGKPYCEDHCRRAFTATVGVGA